MPTEQYRGFKPWTCPGCSQELQFSKAHGCIVQVCFFGLALLSLYLLGLRSWQLIGAALLLGAVLTVVLIGPLGRLFPPQLEPYRPPPWKEDKFVTLFPRNRVHPDQGKQPADEAPKE